MAMTDFLKRVGSAWNSTPTSTLNPLPVSAGTDYETVAAGQTDQVLGATGAAGDYLGEIECQPGTTSPGTVIVKDGSTTVFTFPGGASSVTALYPFPIAINAKSVNGAWSITTGANITALAKGYFT